MIDLNRLIPLGWGVRPPKTSEAPDRFGILAKYVLSLFLLPVRGPHGAEKRIKRSRRSLSHTRS